MAMKPSELNKLNTAFSGIKNRVLEACTETISEIIEDVYEHSRDRVPVQTGNLRSSAEYTITRNPNEVYGESHFGEPGHVGGWEDTEAYTYMWYPGETERNWHGAILYEGWESNKDRIVPEIKANIKRKI